MKDEMKDQNVVGHKELFTIKQYIINNSFFATVVIFSYLDEIFAVS